MAPEIMNPMIPTIPIRARSHSRIASIMEATVPVGNPKFWTVPMLHPACAKKIGKSKTKADTNAAR
jgi:hypothetical protein